VRQLWQQVKEVKELERKLSQVRQELTKTNLEVSSMGVKIVINGEQKILSVKLSPEAAKDVKLLEDLLVVAINEAIAKSREVAQQRLQEIAGGLKIPGLL
jgi:hypothetical protein